MDADPTENLAQKALIEPALRPFWRLSLAQVVIIGVVLSSLAMVVPRLTSAANSDREVFLKGTLANLRTQILMYQSQHEGIAPGYPGGNTAMMPTHEAFVAQLTKYSNSRGQISATPSEDFPFGPYVRRIPQNPMNKSADIRFMQPLDAIPSAGGDQGWIYQPVTGTIAANTAGADIYGVKYIDY